MQPSLDLAMAGPAGASSSAAGGSGFETRSSAVTSAWNARVAPSKPRSLSGWTMRERRRYAFRRSLSGESAVSVRPGAPSERMPSQSSSSASSSTRRAAVRASPAPSSPAVTGGGGAVFSSTLTMPSSISSGEPMAETPCFAAAFFSAPALRAKGSPPPSNLRCAARSFRRSRQTSTPFSPVCAMPRSLLIAFSLAHDRLS
mmetsp:Transcript_2437/g.7190  ORF Transcript_2437/g.7190 Transcript_2437/m.7190 type:complete len:201 (+) Transcript_2437:588-1190(+)